ncbi:TRAP transporter small permease subunit [Iocasia frigidifontis]|uniref:TRAP transporter small permease subunit n=1 Tax=Iocasia fonsfrigidae TaxID=2682810 RepID=A0A8A7KDR6_9FIRM|nr:MULTISPECIES: TRAP transporter small permease [Halanaerobiaceae]AZO93302.1 TRAP transporter small permease [Halocella sp. SP3-1]QTL99561.1 TRAP transporter small permease subunit [Iocasia fonsfrigidae]
MTKGKDNKKHFFIYKPIKKITNFIDVITINFTAILVFIMLIIVLLQIITRFLGVSFSWTEELSRYLLIWIGVLSASAALKRGAHAGVDFFITLFPKRYRNLIVIFNAIIMIFFLFYFINVGWESAIKANRITSTALELKMFWPKVAIPVGGILMIINLIYLVIDNLDRFIFDRNGGM